MKNFKITLLFLSLLIFTAGCQVGKEVRRENISNGSGNTGPNGSAAPLPDLSSNGGSHTGGDNGVKGDSLESYRLNITEKPEFKNQVLPIIQKLNEKFPDLAADLMHVASERKWYFVPVDLNALPASQIGVRFTTDQLAIHKRKEIWVSTVHYNEMNESKKATLILHEIVMGVRLLDFQDKLDKCLARTQLFYLKTSPEAPEEFKKSRQVCFSDPANRLDQGKELRLGDDEHADIRDLTETLLNRLDNIDSVELQGWVKAKNFRHW